MANTAIQLKRSVVSGNVPSTLLQGELALNAADGIIFYKDDVGVIRQIKNSDSYSTINVNSTLLVSTTPSDILSITGNNSITVSGNPLTDTVTISANDSSTTQKGVVQLYDGVNSNSSSLAATANSVNAAYQLANTAYYNSLSSSGTGTLTTNYDVEEFVATSGQTTFNVSNGYIVDYILVYVNGVLLNSSDYTANDGSNVILSSPAVSGDNVSVAKWYFDNSIYLSAIQTYDQFVASNNQSIFTANTLYTPGFIKVYRNGILLEDSEFVANNGTDVFLTHAASNNDIIVLHQWGATAINTSPIYALANNALSVAQSASNTANIFINNLQYSNLFSLTANTSSNTANQILDSFTTTTYRSVKYQIQVSSGTDYQMSEINLIHDGTNAYVSEYGLVTTNSVLMSYDADINGGNVRLLINPINNINTIKLVKTSIVV